MAASGMEMMLSSMLKNMGVDKDAILGQANQVQAIALGLDARLKSIEEKLDLIYEKVSGTLELNLPEGAHIIADDLAVRITEVPSESVTA